MPATKQQPLAAFLKAIAGSCRTRHFSLPIQRQKPGRAGRGWYSLGIGECQQALVREIRNLLAPASSAATNCFGRRHRRTTACGYGSPPARGRATDCEWPSASSLRTQGPIHRAARVERAVRWHRAKLLPVVMGPRVRGDDEWW